MIALRNLDLVVLAVALPVFLVADFPIGGWLTAAGIDHKFNEYPGTRHAFHNDTGQAYNREQALAAWQDTLAWFRDKLAS